MRCLPQNKRRMWLSKPGGLMELKDADGVGTGEFVQADWGEPEPLMINASSPSGVCSSKPYGIFASYDLSLVADSNEWGIKEGDRMWLSDEMPDPSEAKGAYTVDRVSPSLQFVSFGLSKAEGK